MISRISYPRGIMMVVLGLLSLFSLFCASNIIWMQSNTVIEGVITTPELFVQRESSTIVISSHEIKHSLENYIEDFDLGLYFDIPGSYWRSSFLNHIQYRFTSNSNKETTLIIYIEDTNQPLNGYSYDIIDNIHWSHSHTEPPYATYIQKTGDSHDPSFKDSLQAIAASTGKTRNQLDYSPGYEDYYLILHALDMDGVETRLSLGVKMPVFSLLRNLLLIISLVSGSSVALILYGRYQVG